MQFSQPNFVRICEQILILIGCALISFRNSIAFNNRAQKNSNVIKY